MKALCVALLVLVGCSDKLLLRRVVVRSGPEVQFDGPPGRRIIVLPGPLVRLEDPEPRLQTTDDFPDFCPSDRCERDERSFRAATDGGVPKEKKHAAH